MTTRDLAVYFYQQIKKKPSSRELIACIQVAKKLLENHNAEEIKYGIDYFVLNPPPKGFYSLGWLLTTLDGILIKKKAEEVKIKMENVGLLSADGGNYVEDYRYQRDYIPTWIRKGYSLDLFTKSNKDSGSGNSGS